MADPATGYRLTPALGSTVPGAPICSWTLGGLAPGNYEFQVQAIDSALAGGAWSAPAAFTVAPWIEVTVPKGGETWEATAGATVTWDSVGYAGLVDIEYSTDGGASWLPLAMAVVNDGTEAVVAPDIKSTTVLLQVSATDGDSAAATEPVDTSDAVFAVVRPFAELSVGALPGIRGSVALGDCDGDGDLDLADAGYTGASNFTRVYANVGGAFDGSEAASGLPDTSGKRLAWGDCDNDGDLDLALVRSSITAIYVNDGVGGFTEVAGVSMAVHSVHALAWGDCDNDGDLDLAVAGSRSGSYATTVYENVGGAVPFDGTELASGLHGVQNGALAWGDSDNDGDLDLAVTGLTGSGNITKVYENDNPLPNAPPGASTGLGANTAAGQAFLTWLPAWDSETPDLGLSYNLRVRNTSAPATVIDGMAEPATGWRLIPAIGPVRPDTSTCSWTLKGLAAGDYEFQVQAIDSALEGGPWSTACPFTVP
jgi:hypothetical protein